ncbi:uncharacterized protein LOC101237947 [Hydra vulgaris]|uniref:uncharacterized protein LOC101237947 n=1 Tax=Hydra vulgaris TaxID=6087 RepID=UPI000640DD42|nr:uncharacterized protein LOC101237947 [Hydra vulgaris]
MQIAAMSAAESNSVKTEDNFSKEEHIDVVSTVSGINSKHHFSSDYIAKSISRHNETFLSSAYIPTLMSLATSESTIGYPSPDYRNYSYRNGSPPYIDKAPTLSQKDDSTQNSDQPSPSTTPLEDKHVWSKAEVELLLDLYEKNQDQLKDPRVRKTRVWEDIATAIRESLDSDVNGCQCNQKFRNLKADFQKVQEHNGRPGNFKRICKYYDRLVNLLNYSPYAQQKTFSNSINVNGETPHNTPHYFENENIPPLPSLKRKFNDIYLNGHTNNLLSNSHIENFQSKKPRSQCQCECSEEIASLRESIERTNRYILARAAHEDDRVRRLEDVHREKLIAMSRFADIFKDYIHKIV